MKNISQQSLSIILKMQQNELNESYIYREIAKSVKNQYNKETLIRLANEEEVHYNIWKSHTNKELKPNKLKIFKYKLLSKLAKFATVDPKRFQAICDRLKDHEFEDEDFIVRLPRSADEIIEEGSKMHHCVGTYVKRVVSGETIILFLRRKSNIDKEYVTIEMTNDGRLRQLKCKNNAILSSASTLKFVEKWIKAKKLGVDTYDISYTKKKVTPGSAAYTGYFKEKDSIA